MSLGLLWVSLSRFVDQMEHLDHAVKFQVMYSRDYIRKRTYQKLESARCTSAAAEELGITLHVRSCMAPN
jgi:hypothetical protein